MGGGDDQLQHKEMDVMDQRHKKNLEIKERMHKETLDSNERVAQINAKAAKQTTDTFAELFKMLAQQGANVKAAPVQPALPVHATDATDSDDSHIASD